MRLDEAMQSNRPFRLPGGRWLKASGDWFVAIDEPLDEVLDGEVLFESEDWLVDWGD